MTMFLTGNFIFSQPGRRACAFVSYFHLIIKRLSFFNYHSLSHWFFFGTHCCKQLTKHPVQLLKYQDFWTINIQIERHLYFSNFSMRKTSNKVAGRVTAVPGNSAHYEEECSQSTLPDRWCNTELDFFVK
jgi:hypothetical protein